MRTPVLRLLLAAALLGLMGCGPPYVAKLAHPVDVLNRGNGADVSSLDPDYITGNWEAYVVGDCLIGLTTEGQDGSPIPGAAIGWETSPDGKTWTFHLRDHVWSDGVPVSAEDFVFAWRRILDPKIAAPYGYYLYLVRNAQAVNAGTKPASALGIDAPDEKTVVIHLNDPAPFLPEWLMHQTTWPVPRHVVLSKGNAWVKPANNVCNGPYTFKEWIPNDHITMVKNPRFYDAAQVRIRTVNYFPTGDSQSALKMLLAGQLDTQETIPITEIGWMKRNMARALRLDPILSDTFLIFNFQRGKFADRRLREAMDLAYDRESATEKVIRLGDPPAYSIVPPGTANYPGGVSLRFKSMPFAQRLERARALVQEMGYGPANHFRTSYLAAAVPDSRRLAAVLQEMMKQIYVDIDIITVDPANYYHVLSLHQFDMGATAWIGDFNDASTFLDLLETGDGNNYGSYSNPTFDRLYRAAKRETDLKNRGALMAKAEQVALDDYAVIPTRFRVNANLVQTYVRGWDAPKPNLRNFHRTRWLWIEAQAK